MTPLLKMQELEVTLQSLFQHIQWKGDTETIELANEALLQLSALKEQEELIRQIF